ncbi:phage minor capsid protein [Candidatus Methanocrinis natronophilus]|uniref:Phage head morphogenesis domain-containing protein n=1 Tax=Candidatus Methanocrinis natronophilus TaxID=3033396 RepID=A0ABT5XAG9_9EURY|nr:phage minor capsid protein [Candidatus Methanocrinis natronophilus]MDF0591666.1 hypothetical protein [Candidatus Methanocrinis natronophilus]
MADVAKLTEDQASRLIKLYESGDRKIQAEINRVLLAGGDPAYYRAVQRNIKAARNTLLVGGREWCDDAIPFLYRQGIVYADGMSFSTGLSAGFGSIHQQAVSVLAEATYSRLVGVDLTIGRQVDDLLRALQLEYTQSTVLGIDSVDTAARRMKKDLAARGVTGFIDRAGRQWNMASYAKMSVHHATMQSFRSGTVNRLLEHGYDLLVVSRHSEACPKCIPWEGATLSITGETPGYPTLAEARAAGLEHVGCRHTLTLSPQEREKEKWD